MLVVHEVGHALDTPAEKFVEIITEIARRVAGSVSNRAIAAVKDYLNVIEDARIDKRQKRRFPGARRNYIKGYAELIEKDFFGTATRDVNSMIFIDRLNIYFKGGAMLGIKFSPEEKAWLRKVENAETFAEVLTLTEEIFKWAKEQKSERPEQDEDEDDFRMKRGRSNEYGDEEDENEDEEGDEYSFGDSEDDSEDDEENETSGRGKSKSKDEDGEEEGEGGSSDDEGEESEAEDTRGEGDVNTGSGGGGEHTPTGDDTLPESETEKAWQKKAQDLVIDSDLEYIYARIPRIANYDRLVVDYKVVLQEQRRQSARSGDWMKTIAAHVQKFRASESSAISFMVKEFEMRKSADEYSRTSISKTGVIDTNKLHSYKYNDDLFRRITTVATGKNHGFVMFVDWSSSMDYNLKKTLKQLFSLVMFCKRVQIPFEVYTFRTLNATDNGPANDYYTAKPGDLNLNPFKARNVLSSRMNQSEMNEAMVYLYSIACGNRIDCDYMGSTPLNPCIAVAHEIVNRFKAKSKVQVVNVAFLTDGDSDGMDGTVVGTGYSWKNRKYIIQDEITKKSYELPTGNSPSRCFENQYVTPIFLKTLKERTGCNLMGFFICSNTFDRMYGRYNSNAGGKHYTDAKNSWRQNGHFSVTSAGYDEYFIIDAEKFVVASSELKVDSSLSKKKMTSAFIKFAEKKAISRVLLTNIVKRVTA